jgi:hypothetical protein
VPDDDVVEHELRAPTGVERSSIAAAYDETLGTYGARDESAELDGVGPARCAALAPPSPRLTVACECCAQMPRLPRDRSVESGHFPDRRPAGDRRFGRRGRFLVRDEDRRKFEQRDVAEAAADVSLQGRE